jgi:hypothetical protein
MEIDCNKLIYLKYNMEYIWKPFFLYNILVIKPVVIPAGLRVWDNF